jgi:lipopolysaccharide transport system ATP-binding protein
MSAPVISVHGLSKRYILGAMAGHDTLRDQLAHGARSLWRAFRSAPKPAVNGAGTDVFWALKDVSFELGEGEVLGVVGRNGAGKSTLLKVLSQITEPTAGEITVRGRVASLLEVGTGFHPELTGRENVYLNGAVLGMTRREIRSKFDEIVAFSEVEKFLDTPVKRYSSGMYVRLAFAVAAHLEPDILIVDEVLAVGDAQFQAKCLAKMDNVARGGRTVLFVSHNLAAVRGLCSRGLYLRRGLLEYQGPVDSVCDRYLSDVRSHSGQILLTERSDRRGSGRVKIAGFRVLDPSGAIQPALMSGKDYTFVIDYQNPGRHRLPNIIASIAITNEMDQMLLLVRSTFSAHSLAIDNERGAIQCSIKDLNLAVGTYNITLYLANGEAEVLDWIERADQLSVDGGDYFGTGSFGLPAMCKTLTRAEWRAE